MGAVESWACGACGPAVRETRARWAEGREKLERATRERDQATGKERGMGSWAGWHLGQKGRREVFMINFKLMKNFIFLCFHEHKKSKLNHFSSISKNSNFRVLQFYPH